MRGGDPPSDKTPNSSKNGVVLYKKHLSVIPFERGHKMQGNKSSYDPIAQSVPKLEQFEKMTN